MRGCSASTPGFVASGPTGDPTGHTFTNWDTDDFYGDWYGGHELGHAHGRSHTLCRGDEAGPDTSYPYNGGIIGGPTGNTDRYVGWDIELRRTYPSNWTDIMTYCANEWMSDYTYNGLRSRISSEATSTASAEARRVGEEVLAVLGTADLERGTAELGTLYRSHEIPLGERTPVEEEWVLELRDRMGRTLAGYPFVPLPNISGVGPGPEQRALINEVVPFTCKMVF